jgi:hypothetical protein
LILDAAALDSFTPHDGFRGLLWGACFNFSTSLGSKTQGLLPSLI